MQNMTTYKLQIKNYTKVQVIPKLITIKYKRENEQYTNWNILTVESFKCHIELTILKIVLS